jgi:hypothetical protein
MFICGSMIASLGVVAVRFLFCHPRLSAFICGSILDSLDALAVHFLFFPGGSDSHVVTPP